MRLSPRSTRCAQWLPPTYHHNPNHARASHWQEPRSPAPLWTLIRLDNSPEARRAFVPRSKPSARSPSSMRPRRCLQYRERPVWLSRQRPEERRPVSARARIELRSASTAPPFAPSFCAFRPLLFCSLFIFTTLEHLQERTQTFELCEASHRLNGFIRILVRQHETRTIPKLLPELFPPHRFFSMTARHSIEPFHH